MIFERNTVALETFETGTLMSPLWLLRPQLQPRMFLSQYLRTSLILSLFRVQQDIIKSLKLDVNRLFTALHPFNRENLFYEVYGLTA